MKKSTYITFTALTVFMLLIMPYIPHQHHEGALCMIVEHCEVDDTDNDEHTSHNGDNTLCIEDERILISKSDTYHDNLTSKFFPVLISTINSLVSGEIELVTDSDFGYEFPILYPSAYVSRSNALRAPPYLLV